MGFDDELAPPKAPQVYIITLCANLAQLYGTTLVFKTLRVGFPTAPVTVIDNCSLPEARPTIEALARATGCRYLQYDDAMRPHHLLVWHILKEHEDDPSAPVVLIDPDVIFWERCEDWTFEALIAGRLIPAFYDEFSGCYVLPRLHTSFLWIPDVARLWYAYQEVLAKRLELAFFTPFAFPIEGRWFRIETAAGLYTTFTDRTYAFGEEQLTAYDHLFCGTHLNMILENLTREDLFSESGPTDLYSVLIDPHRAARDGDYAALRGLWRAQERYFRARAWTLAAIAAGQMPADPVALKAARDRTMETVYPGGLELAVGDARAWADLTAEEQQAVAARLMGSW